MFKKLGIGRVLLVYLACISGAVALVSTLFFQTSQGVLSSLVAVSETGMQQMSMQNSLIKSMALVHSNILPLAAETDPDSQEIRIELVKGFWGEFVSLLEKCGNPCDLLQEDKKKYEAEWLNVSGLLANKNQAAAAQAILNNLNPLAEVVFDKLDKAATATTKTTNDAISASRESASKAKVTILVMLGVLISGILIVGFFFQRRLVAALHEVAEKVLSSVANTTQKSSEISVSSNTLSQAATRQAASIEETVASIEEMSSMVKRNAEHAQAAAEFSQQSTEAAKDGGSEINVLITSMREISQSSKKIEEIIAVIDDIAFQTNLLALNASVEAARAGEQGKGFAVVAEAVRSLAQRSAEAAKEIGVIIHTSVEQTERGTKLADRSGAALQKIIELIQKLDALNNEIAVASSEQAQGIAQLSQAMSEIDQVTQTNASVAEALSSNSEALAKEAEDLHNSTFELETLLRGSKSAASDGSH